MRARPQERSSCVTAVVIRSSFTKRITYVLCPRQTLKFGLFEPSKSSPVVSTTIPRRHSTLCCSRDVRTGIATRKGARVSSEQPTQVRLARALGANYDVNRKRLGCGHRLAPHDAPHLTRLSRAPNPLPWLVPAEATAGACPLPQPGAMTRK